MRKGRKKKKNSAGMCETCQNAVACGEGCFVCLEGNGETKHIIEDYSPAEDYYWCSGKKYE